jgi:enoyl-[acyl-carrier protein] reductase II
VSTLVAVRRVLQEVSCPVIAGGGVADGYGIAALLALGADAVQLGTRFIMTEEARVHPAYKRLLLDAEVDSTALVGPAALPVRVCRNAFVDRALSAAAEGLEQADRAAWNAMLAAATLKAAALDGDVENGKVEAGQSAGLVGEIAPAAVVVETLVRELEQAADRMRLMWDRAAGARPALERTAR